MVFLITYLGFLLLGINLILFAKISITTRQKSFVIFTTYLLAMVLIQTLTSIYHLKSLNNIFLSHFYFILQFVILSFFYFTILNNKKQKKIVKTSLIICLLVLTIQYLLDKSLFFHFNMFEIFITSYLLIVYSFFHLYNSQKSKKYFYYLNIGLLFYLFTSTILFLFGNLINSNSNSKTIWVINNILYVIYQLFILAEWYHIRFSNKAGIKK
jgi:hypothetical protein